MGTFPNAGNPNRITAQSIAASYTLMPALTGSVNTSLIAVGWAADGFPVYAKYGYTRAGDAASPIELLASSYSIKAAPDANRAAVSLYPMGTFTQDDEYVSGLGELDECNGRTGVTPEFPSGIHHYVITTGYPYIQRCVKGTAAASPPPRP